MDKFSFFIALTVICLTGSACKPAPAADTKPALQVSCNNLPFFYGREDGRSIDVYAQPILTSEKLGSIPADIKGDDQGIINAVTINVNEGRDGWFRFSGLTDAVLNDDSGVQPRKIYNGAGWIRSEDITAVVQTRKAFVNPSPDSKIVASFPDDFSSYAGPQQFLGCTGDWVKVSRPKNEYNDKQWTGWVRGICGALETSCEGLVGDR